MRTDVKVGLICLFAIVLGVVIYFVAQGNAHLQKANGNTPAASGSAGIPAAHADNPPPALQVAPGGAGSSSPAADGSRSLVPAGGPGAAGVSGGIITSPGSSSDRAAAAAGSASATGPASIASAPPSLSGPNIPPLTGGTPAIPNNTFIPGTGGIAAAPPSTPGGGSGLRPTVRFGSSDSSPFSDRTSSRRSAPGSFSSNSSSTTFGATAGSATTYKIQKGDMLGTVAHKFNVTIKAIEAANPGIDSTRLKIDSTINIPTPSATGSSSIERPTIAIGGSPATHPSRSARNSSSGTSVASTTGGAIKAGAPYTVKKGDTLGTIALEAYGSKNAWQRIFRANRSEIGDPNLVREGTILRIPN